MTEEAQIPAFGTALGRLALARGEVDRSAHFRNDEEWLAAAWARPDTRVVVVDHGRALVRFAGDGAELVFTPPAQAPEAPRGVRFLLGVADDGVVYFGVDGSLPGPDGPAGQAGLMRSGQRCVRDHLLRPWPARRVRCGRPRCARSGRCCPTGTPA